MSPLQSKKLPKAAEETRPTKDPIAARIEKLQYQVRRFEEKGYTDTPHHQELARLLGQTPPVRNADSDAEELDNGK
jgi:hypothetical protein